MNKASGTIDFQSLDFYSNENTESFLQMVHSEDPCFFFKFYFIEQLMMVKA